MSTILSKDKVYKEWLEALKKKIQSSQIKAAIKVNTELLNLYWQLGEEIIAKQKESNWGDAIIDQLSKDLTIAFPGMKGFSKRNLFYVRQWYLFYAEGFKKLPQLVAQLDPGNLPNSNSEFVPQLVAQIPWGHNREIISKCSGVEEAIYYVQQTIKNNWSRAVLVAQIETKLYQRQGKAIHNFEVTLPQPMADLARETFKNPYVLDFLTIGKEAQERDLEQALTAQIQKFLLELGQGFAYMGKQYPIHVGDSDFFLDLLFYHTRLRSYIIVELKVTDFQPEFAGKLNFYLNVIDDQLRHPSDQPSIGILLCKTPNKVVVEYALKNVNSPLGVAEYQLTEAIPENLKGELPSIEDLERELKDE
ncbi:MAG: PDDEXK nuclease domain-containing protein [Bacteroidota bacterium]|nr:PDDEXK nuclease domain-containing protein [Bacteroidota bacterium]